MPRPWAGKWQGGRYYLDEFNRPVFFIERRGRVVKLDTHDETAAVGELSRFLVDPAAYEKPAATPRLARGPVRIDDDRIAAYLHSIRDAVADHRAARKAQLRDWSAKDLDLRAVDRKDLRKALASFGGGYRGRVEALNAFCRWLVKEGELDVWRPLENPFGSKATRAEREAYSLEQLRETYARLPAGPVRDVFRIRAATGMHHTEIEQLAGAKVLKGPLPDQGVAIRDLGGSHEIRGVLQYRQKTKPRHRQSVDEATFEAALRLREGVPDRITVWEALKPLVPSNLRHTFVTLAQEVGEVVTYTAAGVDRSVVAQVIGHREGSKMTGDRYDKVQVPKMVRLPLGF